MSGLRARVVGLCGILFAASGCAVPRTEVVVNVATDIPWGPGMAIQSLRLEVRRGGPSGALRFTRFFALTGGVAAARLPVSFGILPAADETRTPLWIEVIACPSVMAMCNASGAVVVQRTLISFVEEKTLEVDLLLTASCRGVVCARDFRCDVVTRQCVNARQTGRELVGDVPTPPQLDAATRG